MAEPEEGVSLSDWYNEDDFRTQVVQEQKANEDAIAAGRIQKQNQINQEFHSYSGQNLMELERKFQLNIPRVLEMYDFPPVIFPSYVATFLTDYIEDNFLIKMVDDTHVLIIFNNEEDAAKALQIPLTTCRLRPLIEASVRSKQVMARGISQGKMLVERP